MKQEKLEKIIALYARSLVFFQKNEYSDIDLEAGRDFFYSLNKKEIQIIFALRDIELALYFKDKPDFAEIFLNKIHRYLKVAEETELTDFQN